MSIHWLFDWFACWRSRQTLRSPQRVHRIRPVLEALGHRWLPSITTLASLMDAPGGGEPVSPLVADSSGNLFGTTMRGGEFGDGTIFEVLSGSNTIRVLASFNGFDGAEPRSGPVRDSSGNLFGTTHQGGPLGLGTVYELPKDSSSITTLAAFSGLNGAYPIGGLTLDSNGNLFGTTFGGGPGWGPNQSSYGVVFEVAYGSRSITVLASFDGYYAWSPQGGLLEDSNGNLFGTSPVGGSSADGTVYEVQESSSSITIIATFNGANGAYPYGSVVMDASGDIFGITEGGGSDSGTLFEIPHGTSSVTTLVNFDSTTGLSPSDDLYQDSSGNLFGTTGTGGVYGYGTIFELPHGGNETTRIGSFDSPNMGDQQAGVVEDNSGNFFGVNGAVYTSAGSEGGLFEMRKGSSSATTISTFQGITGYDPHSTLAEDSAGNLYGTTSQGGAFNDGTVFEVHHSSNVLAILATFNGVNGFNAGTNLVVDGDGNLFGTTSQGGAFDDGTVFEILAGSGTITTLASFNGANGGSPYGSLILDSSGNLFGTTVVGGLGGYGTVFELPHASHTITTLASFSSSGSTGFGPNSLVESSSGSFFGTTAYGGTNGWGTVFEIPEGGGNASVVASFSQFDSNTPNGIVVDGRGDLFGTTANSNAGDQHGTVFEVPSGSNTIVTLATFPSLGAISSSLVVESSGNLFGTTELGGVYGDGSVFEVQNGSGTITTVASFNGANGNGPVSLIADTNGNLFGVTASGGATNDGTVFELPPPPINLPAGTAGTQYSQTIMASGGIGSLTFSETGTLPAGLTLSTSGVLSGTPTSAGNYTFTVTATDSVGSSASHDYALTISPGPFAQFLVTLGGSSTVQAGSGFVVAVQAADQFGNPVTSYGGQTSVPVSISPKVSSFPNTVTINGQGLGLFLGTIQQTGSYTIGVSGASTSVTIIPGPPAKLAFAAAPGNTPTGVPLAPVSVQIEDLYGNVITGDNSDIVTLAVAAGPGSFTSQSTLTATAQNGVATFNDLTLVTPGSYQFSAVVPGLYTGPNSASFNILPLQVLPGSFQGTPSGFSLQLDAPILINSLTPALYSGGSGAGASVTPTVTLTQVSGTPPTGSSLPYQVSGSLVVNTANNKLTFVETNTASLVGNDTPLLPDGTYVVDIHSSGINGLQAFNSGGGYLDGTNSGTPGHDFTATFTVGATAAGNDIVWIPATADGPGQTLSAPGMNQVGGGYPVYLDDNSGKVTDVQATLSYNPTLLSVTPSSTAMFTVTVPTPGTAVLHYNGAALAAGTKTPIGFITATVPAGTPGNPTPYKAKDLLHLSNISLNGGTVPTVGGDAVHLVAYVGDADGNGSYSSNDSVLITRALLSTDSGFTAYPLVDPVIVADTDGAGFIPADAALQANEAGVAFPTANLPVPPIPSGAVFQPVANNVDPTLSIASNLQSATGGIISVPVNLDDAHPTGSTGLIRGHIALTYNPPLFTVSAGDVHPGSLLLAGGDWTIVPTIDQHTGQVAIAFSSDTPIISTLGGSLVTIEFHATSGDGATGPAAFQLVASASPNGQYVATELEDAQGTFTLTPAPSNGFNPAIDATVALPVASGGVVPGVGASSLVVAASLGDGRSVESDNSSSEQNSTATAVSVALDVGKTAASDMRLRGNHGNDGVEQAGADGSFAFSATAARASGALGGGIPLLGVSVNGGQWLVNTYLQALARGIVSNPGDLAPFAWTLTDSLSRVFGGQLIPSATAGDNGLERVNTWDAISSNPLDWQGLVGDAHPRNRSGRGDDTSVAQPALVAQRGDDRAALDECFSLMTAITEDE